MKFKLKKANMNLQNITTRYNIWTACPFQAVLQGFFRILDLQLFLLLATNVIWADLTGKGHELRCIFHNMLCSYILIDVCLCS